MHRLVIAVCILPVGLLCGCGGSTSQATLPSPRHGGNLVELPESLGFAELGIERGLSPKGAQKGRNLSRIVAYFYQPDATTALSPAPTDVKVTLGAGGQGTGVALVPQTKQPGQFASEPGVYRDELRGKIFLQLDGKPVEAVFSFR